jgi:uncharacterized protein (PEP-CTERM system associated)
MRTSLAGCFVKWGLAAPYALCVVALAHAQSAPTPLPSPVTSQSGIPDIAGANQPATQPPTQPTAQQRKGWSITPSISANETFTDNVTFAPAGLERSDWVTEIKPRIQVRGIGARIKLELDYELQKFFYARNSNFDRTQNSLRSTATVEAIEKFFYVDARASISQQSTAPLKFQNISGGNFTTDRAEIRLFSLSPYIKGGIGSIANYEVRHNVTQTSSGSGGNNSISDTRTKEWIARASNRTPLANFGWALDYSNRNYTFGTSEREFEQTRATLLYQIDPQLKLFAYTGREKNDFSAGTQSYSNHGYGFDWRPTPRTQVSGQQDDRFFGKGYNYRFNHRTPLSAWSLGYSRDISSSADQLQVETPTDAYTALFNSAFFLAQYPDPALRDVAVRSFLALNGLAATTNQTLLSNRVVLSRRLNGSFALIGARNTLTFTASRSESSSASGTGLVGGADIFSQSTGIRQRTISAAWSHKISAVSTLNLNASHTRSEGSAPTVQSSTHRLLNLTLTHRLGPKTLGSLGLRKAIFDAQGGSLTSYDEKALTGSLSVTF